MPSSTVPESILLDVRSRPRGVALACIVACALIAGGAGAWFTTALDAAIRPSLPLALGIGCAIAVGVLFFALQGARIVVGSDRVLVYSLHGRPNLAFDLNLATSFRPIAQGLVTGLGVELSDLRQVRFLHKAGISPERMRRWRAQLGVDLVLEGFPAELATRLRELRSG